jgi:hypothetical protein
MKRHIVTSAFLVIAIFFYAVGGTRQGTIFLLLGVLAEATFWVRLFGRRDKK